MPRAGRRAAARRDEAPGGLLRFGVPDAKLEKWIIDRRLLQMEMEGVTFRTGAYVGDARQTIEALARHYGFPKTARWRDLPDQAQEVLLYGSKGETISVRVTASDGAARAGQKDGKGAARAATTAASTSSS